MHTKFPKNTQSIVPLLVVLKVYFWDALYICNYKQRKETKQNCTKYITNSQVLKNP